MATKKAADEKKQVALAEVTEVEVSATKKAVRWTQTEIEQCAQSLYSHGNSTTYVTMSEHVMTFSIPAIKSYYTNGKLKLIRMNKKYAKKHWTKLLRFS